MVEVFIHSSLTRFTDNQQVVKLPIETIAELIPTLCQQYPLLTTSLVTEMGELTPYVNCYINGENMNAYAPNTKLMPDAKIDLITALVGG